MRWTMPMHRGSRCNRRLIVPRISMGACAYGDRVHHDTGDTQRHANPSQIPVSREAAWGQIRLKRFCLLGFPIPAAPIFGFVGRPMRDRKSGLPFVTSLDVRKLRIKLIQVVLVLLYFNLRLSFGCIMQFSLQFCSRYYGQ